MNKITTFILVAILAIPLTTFAAEQKKPDNKQKNSVKPIFRIIMSPLYALEHGQKWALSTKKAESVLAETAKYPYFTVKTIT